MTAIGSVFLGDFQRLRLLSSSTQSPPSSPPPGHSPNMSGFPAQPSPPLPADAAKVAARQPPASIDPALSLELRLRWLEAILLGARQEPARDRKGKERADIKPGETLLRAAEDIQRRLDDVVERNEGLKRFMGHYDQHAHLLTPAFALSGALPGAAPSYGDMSSDELEALLVEMEPDIRAADRDMSEIEALEKKGVTGAGKLADYEALQPRLDALTKAHSEDLKRAKLLENRVTALMERHTTHVDALSELFVAWDDTITETEFKMTRLERQQQERQRLGYE